MAKLLVKQVRSKINCPLDKREALGLRKWDKL
jgi:ribosomal protein L30/L7E